MWFLDEANKTGCRFSIVDAKNEDKVLRLIRFTHYDKS